VSTGCQNLAWKAGHKRQCNRMGQYAKASALPEERKKIVKEVDDRAGVGRTCGNLKLCYERMGQYAKAIALHEEDKKMAEEVGVRAGVGSPWGGRAATSRTAPYIAWGSTTRQSRCVSRTRRSRRRWGTRQGWEGRTVALGTATRAWAVRQGDRAARGREEDCGGGGGPGRGGEGVLQPVPLILEGWKVRPSCRILQATL
jgi:hypothetical protein